MPILPGKKRLGFAKGGMTSDDDTSVFHGSGPFTSAGAGRTDIHNRDVPANGFVVPADVVSGLAEGNTAGGNNIIARMMGSAHGVAHRPNAVKTSGDVVPVVVAGGEYYIHPEDIIRKFGSLDRGHKILRQWVIHRRQKNIKELTKLPGPKK